MEGINIQLRKLLQETIFEILLKKGLMVDMYNLYDSKTFRMMYNIIYIYNWEY